MFVRIYGAGADQHHLSFSLWALCLCGESVFGLCCECLVMPSHKINYSNYMFKLLLLYTMQHHPVFFKGRFIHREKFTVGIEYRLGLFP